MFGGINFTPNVDLGHAFDAIVFLLTFVGIIFTLRNDVKGLKTDMSMVKSELTKITEVITQQARYDERLNALERRMEDWIYGPRRETSDAKPERVGPRLIP